MGYHVVHTCDECGKRNESPTMSMDAPTEEFDKTLRVMDTMFRMARLSFLATGKSLCEMCVSLHLAK